MKVLKRKFKSLIVSFLTIMCVMGTVGHSYGQQYKLSVGSNITKFNYINSEGAPIDFMKSGSGNRFSVGSEFRILDTTKMQLALNSRALYFNQRPRLAKILSMVKYDVSLESNQYNAVGDIQNIAFSYQTSYLGASAGLGVHIPLRYGISIALQGRLAAQKIIQGNQQIGQKFYDLTVDDQFKNIQIMYGYSGEIQKSLGNNLDAFLSYQYLTTQHGQQAGVATLNLVPTTISFGIKILK